MWYVIVIFRFQCKVVSSADTLIFICTAVLWSSYVYHGVVHWEKKDDKINGKESRRQFHVGVALLSR